MAGTIESEYTDVDLPSIVIGQARDVAQDLGVTEEEAVQVAAQATIDAMADLPVNEQAEAWDAILRELIVEDDQRRANQADDVSEMPNQPSNP